MLLMMGGKAPETCWATHERHVINLWYCCILLVDLFESYDDARTSERQIYVQYIVMDTRLIQTGGGKNVLSIVGY